MNGTALKFDDDQIKKYRIHGIVKIPLGDKTGHGNKNDIMPGKYFVNLVPLLENGSVKRMWMDGRKGKVAFCISSGKQEAGNRIQKRVEIEQRKALESQVEITYTAKHSGGDDGFEISGRYSDGETFASVIVPKKAAAAADTL